MENFFGFKGRIDRLHYLGILVFTVVIRVIISLLNPDSLFGSFISLIVWIVCAWIFACAAVKRFHDINKSGEHSWLLLIPFYNLYLGFGLLLARKGTSGPNKYGDDPSILTVEAKSIETSENKALSTDSTIGIMVGLFILAIVLSCLFATCPRTSFISSLCVNVE